MHSASWRSSVTERYGTAPVTTWFETPVVVENVARQVLADEEASSTPG